MLDALKTLMRRMGGEPAKPHFSEDDTRLALAALLVHCTAVDGAISQAEQAKLRELLHRTFGLTGDDLDTLLADAVAAEQDAVDLYRFTSVLKRGMTEAERVAVVENLWEIAFSDGASHEFEENLVWRVAELLSVSRQDRIAKKRVVTENKARES